MDHQDPELTGRNLLPPRSRFTSYPSVEAALAGVNDGVPSPWERSLNGQWRFALYPRPTDVPADWATRDLPDEIEVPSHWQLAGTLTPAGGRYGDISRPHYTNWQYPFPIHPPHVPSDRNPTGVYRLTFAVPDGWRGMRKIVRFDGVDGCMTLACNGREVGLNKGSRLMAEFDLTEFLRDGENTIAVRVIQYGDHSYLEDQDMWWLSGIFRDVTLLAEPADGVADVMLNAPASGKLTVRVPPGEPSRRFHGLFVFGPGGETLLSEPFVDDGHEPVVWADASMPRGEPWTAERPTLYTVVVHRETSLGSQFIPLRVGFRTIDIAPGGAFRVNGTPVKLRGVNRHEWSQTRGRALTRQDMLDDVLLMKRHNVNCVRTAHYPPHPHFLELCDRHGLYVIDECDLESHGMTKAARPFWLSDDPAWRAAHIDRIDRTVARDRNHASVVIWSLGNESGYGPNIAAMARRSKELDPTRPVHYEGDWRGDTADVISQMYTDPQRLAEAGRGGEIRPPYWSHDEGAMSGADYADKPCFPLRVRPRDGQRPRRFGGLRRGLRRPRPPHGRLHLGVDRPRPAHASPRRQDADQLRRRLRRRAQRRQLRARRPAVQRPHALAGRGGDEGRVRPGSRPPRGRVD